MPLLPVVWSGILHWLWLVRSEVQHIRHCELKELKHQVAFLDNFLDCTVNCGIYSEHPVDVMACVLCILLWCCGIYAVNFVVMLWHICPASCCIVRVCVLFIFF